MITLHPGAGRFAGIRIISPVTEEEFARFVPEVGQWTRSIPSQVVFCSDLRGAKVLTDSISNRVIASMRQDNPKLKRAAVLLPSGSAVLALQFERILREAGNPARRTFRRSAELLAWLGEVLRPAEQACAVEFLAEGDELELDAGSRRSSAPPEPPRDRPSKAGPPSSAVQSTPAPPTTSRRDKPSWPGPPKGESDP